jgi:hypothetical protein
MLRNGGYRARWSAAPWQRPVRYVFYVTDEADNAPAPAGPPPELPPWHTAFAMDALKRSKLPQQTGFAMDALKRYLANQPNAPARWLPSLADQVSSVLQGGKALEAYRLAMAYPDKNLLAAMSSDMTTAITIPVLADTLAAMRAQGRAASADVTTALSITELTDRLAALRAQARAATASLTVVQQFQGTATVVPAPAATVTVQAHPGEVVVSDETLELDVDQILGQVARNGFSGQSQAAVLIAVLIVVSYAVAGFSLKLPEQLQQMLSTGTGILAVTLAIAALIKPPSD